MNNEKLYDFLPRDQINKNLQWFPEKDENLLIFKPGEFVLFYYLVFKQFAEEKDRSGFSLVQFHPLNNGITAFYMQSFKFQIHHISKKFHLFRWEFNQTTARKMQKFFNDHFIDNNDHPTFIIFNMENNRNSPNIKSISNLEFDWNVRKRNDEQYLNLRRYIETNNIHTFDKNLPRITNFSKEEELKLSFPKWNVVAYKFKLDLVQYWILRSVFPKDIVRSFLSLQTLVFSGKRIHVSGGRVYSPEHAKELDFEYDFNRIKKSKIDYTVNLEKLILKFPLLQQYFPNAKFEMPMADIYQNNKDGVFIIHNFFFN